MGITPYHLTGSSKLQNMDNLFFIPYRAEKYSHELRYMFMCVWHKTHQIFYLQYHI